MDLLGGRVSLPLVILKMFWGQVPRNVSIFSTGGLGSVFNNVALVTVISPGRSSRKRGMAAQKAEFSLSQRLLPHQAQYS
jgi:hypothetical protein